MASPASKSSSKSKTPASATAPDRKRSAGAPPAPSDTAAKLSGGKPSGTSAPSSGAKPNARKPPPTLAERIEKARAMYAGLRVIHPDAHCELDHANAFQLLVATVLSAQTTDKLVNKATPSLFAKYPDAAALAAAEQEAVAEVLKSGGLGMYNNKSKSIVGLARGLMADHSGEVPRSMDALIKLPGVGRKTANVVLGVIWGTPDGVVVDTHVMRLSQRLGFTKKQTPEEIELALCKLFPREDWDMLSHTLIFHGRRVCAAQKPACAACGVSASCPNAFNAEHVGRK